MVRGVFTIQSRIRLRRHSGAGRNPGEGCRGVESVPAVTVAATLNGLSFPLCGNVWYQPLDSGLRRNDGKVDSGLRRAVTGILGGLFPTPLYL